jgi:hypothetical protein
MKAVNKYFMAALSLAVLALGSGPAVGTFR